MKHFVLIASNPYVGGNAKLDSTTLFHYTDYSVSFESEAQGRKYLREIGEISTPKFFKFHLKFEFILAKIRFV